jgi:hypothetical protein
MDGFRPRSLGDRAPALGLAAALCTCSCGYRAVYGGIAPARLHVALVRTLVPDAAATDEVVAGMREELAREGALDAGVGYPRAEVEVLLADEASEGISAVGGRPVARATQMALVARAWIVREPGAPPESDTGDLREEEVIAVDETSGAIDPRTSAFREADARRAAGASLGRALARKLTRARPP